MAILSVADVTHMQNLPSCGVTDTMSKLISGYICVLVIYGQVDGRGLSSC